MRCTRLAANTGRKKSPSRYHRTTLSGHIFATKASIDNPKKNLLSSNTSSTCPDNGELRPTNGWDRFGSLWHPYTFQRVLRLVPHSRHRAKIGEGRPLWRRGAGSPSNTMQSGPKAILIPNDILIQPVVWLQYTYTQWTTKTWQYIFDYNFG